jgi:hypothetical protein
MLICAWHGNAVSSAPSSGQVHMHLPPADDLLVEQIDVNACFLSVLMQLTVWLALGCRSSGPHGGLPSSMHLRGSSPAALQGLHLPCQVLWSSYGQLWICQVSWYLQDSARHGQLPSWLQVPAVAHAPQAVEQGAQDVATVQGVCISCFQCATLAQVPVPGVPHLGCKTWRAADRLGQVAGGRGCGTQRAPPPDLLPACPHHHSSGLLPCAGAQLWRQSGAQLAGGTGPCQCAGHPTHTCVECLLLQQSHQVLVLCVGTSHCHQAGWQPGLDCWYRPSATGTKGRRVGGFMQASSISTTSNTEWHRWGHATWYCCCHVWHVCQLQLLNRKRELRSCSGGA